jgi:hypothetical protein
MSKTMKVNQLFVRKANRPCVFFKEYGLVPIADNILDSQVSYLWMNKPKQIGDEAIVYVERQFRKVKLLKSSGQVRDNLYLVDMGPGHPCG